MSIEYRGVSRETKKWGFGFYVEDSLEEPELMFKKLKTVVCNHKVKTLMYLFPMNEKLIQLCNKLESINQTLLSVEV